MRVAEISTAYLVVHVELTNLAAKRPLVKIRTWLANNGHPIRETRAATVTADLLPRLRAALDLAQEAVNDMAARRDV